MRSWMILIAYTIVLIIVTLVEGDVRPKRGGDYGFGVSLLGYGGGAALAGYGGAGPISTSFDCAAMPFPGIYADVNAGCRSFHICAANSGPGSTIYCPKDTMFNQQHFVCDWWYNVNCDSSPQYYDLNAKLQGKGSHHYGGSSQDNGHDIFQALFTAKESATIAADHAARAADAASAAKSAAQAKQILAQQQIHAIKASAQSQLNAARRAAQLATSYAHSRAAAAHRSAAVYEAEALSRANAAVNDASALKVEANVQFAIANAASEANRKSQVAKLHLDIQEEARNKALDHQARVTQAHVSQPHTVNVDKLIANAAKDANGQTKVANLHLAIQDKARNNYFNHQARTSQLRDQKQTNGHLDAAVTGVIADAATKAGGQAQVADLHLDIQVGARQKYYDHQARASQLEGQKQGTSHLAATTSDIIVNAANEADVKAKVANLHLAIKDRDRQKYHDHHGSASHLETTGGHLVSAVAGVIAAATEEAIEKSKDASLQLEIQQKARKNAFDHQQKAAQKRYSHGSNTATIRDIVTNAAEEASAKENVARQQLTIQDKVRQFSYSHYNQKAHGHRRHYVRAAKKNGTNGAAVFKVKEQAKHHRRHAKDSTFITNSHITAAVTGAIGEAAGEANGKAEVVNLQLEIQENARQNAFDHHQRAAKKIHDHGNSAAKIGDIIANAAADASGKEATALQQLAIQDKARQTAFSDYNQQASNGYQDTAAQSVTVIGAIVANAAAEAGDKEEAAIQQLVIQDKVRQYSFAQHNQRSDGHKRHYVRATNKDDAEAIAASKEKEEVSHQLNENAKPQEDANAGLKERKSAKNQQDKYIEEKEVLHTSEDSANSMDNVQSQIINQQKTRAKDSMATNPEASNVSTVIDEQEATKKGPHHRQKRGYHDGGYIDIERIIQDAASGASLQADTARLYVNIREKARQQHYNQYSRGRQQSHGHHRRQANATTRSDGKARLAGKENKKQSAMHYGDEKEADATKVTTNPTSEADRKANPINPKSHQRKAREVYPCHRCNVWQIIGNAAAETNGQTEVARLQLEIQENARKSYYQQHERATQQTHYGH